MKFIIGNWKCEPQSWAKANQIFAKIKKGLKGLKASRTEIVICPPFLYLEPLRAEFLSQGRHKIKLGAQDVFWEENGGPFTGEISPAQLRALKVKYVLLGHSERRQYLKESNAFVRQKLKTALKAGLRPVLCVGETASQKENKSTFKVLRHQLVQALKGVSRNKASQILIAYEPVWAIGTGKSCPIEEAVVCCLYLKKVFSQIFTNKAAQRLPILYGGSVKQSNARAYLKERALRGLLLGSASLDPQQFSAIVRTCGTCGS